MPKHKPIRFSEPKLSEELKEQMTTYLRKHPIASNTAKVVFATALLGGVITTLAVAPGLGLILGKAVSASRRAKRDRYRKLWERFHAFKKRNLVEFVGENSEGEMVYSLTNNGLKEAKRFLIETLELKPPKKWDGKWRIIVFDIPEKFKFRRRVLQEKLREIGFYPLQKSVLIHPFPCEAETEFLKDFFEVGKYVEVFTTADMPNGRAVYYFKELLADYV